MAVTYCTATNVRNRLTGLTVAVMSDTIVDGHITRAEDMINAKIGSRLAVPFTGTIPQIIQTICVELASFYVMTSLFTEDSQNRSEWTNIFKDVNKTLDGIAAGTISVQNIAGTDASVKVSGLQSSMQVYQPVFDMDGSENWTVDSDLKDAIADNR